MGERTVLARAYCALGLVLFVLLVSVSVAKAQTPQRDWIDPDELRAARG